MTISENLAAVRARIDAAARGCGRDPSTVRLIAVSKTKSEEAVREAYAAGQRAFGESYAQELERKAQALADRTEIEWHFIGHLQSNKAKVLARWAHVTHTVDGEALAKELGRRIVLAGRGPHPVLVEVKLSREPTKHGASPEDLEDVLRAVESQDGLRLRGLMTMPELGELEAARSAFSTLASLRNLHGGAARLPELSMGMSSDLETAIACGATLVRVGTGIFGARGA